MAGKMSEQEVRACGELDAKIISMIANGCNPYHVAMALGRVRWDLLTITNREQRRNPGLLPEELRHRVGILLD